MMLILWLAWVLSLAPVQSQQPAVVSAVVERAPAQATGSKIWIGRYTEFEEFIRSAKIERLKDIGLGVTRPRHAYFAPGGIASGAIVKHLPPGRNQGYWESYKSEIAAYKLDRLLELDMVPPTVEREVDRETVSAQLWVDNTRMLKEAKDHAPDTDVWNRQVFRQRVFDDLIANIDENAGNVLIDPAWNLILIDHSRCFTSTTKLPFPTDKLTQIDRPLFDKLKALDRETVTREVGKLMDGGALKTLFERRDQIVKWYEGLAAQKGDAAVFGR